MSRRLAQIDVRTLVSGSRICIGAKNTHAMGFLELLAELPIVLFVLGIRFENIDLFIWWAQHVEVNFRF